MLNFSNVWPKWNKLPKKTDICSPITHFTLGKWKSSLLDSFWNPTGKFSKEPTISKYLDFPTKKKCESRHLNRKLTLEIEKGLAISGKMAYWFNLRWFFPLVPSSQKCAKSQSWTFRWKFGENFLSNGPHYHVIKVKKQLTWHHTARSIDFFPKLFVKQRQ